jgi:hypothetical protein
MSRALPPEMAVAALRRGKPLAQWLGARQDGEETFLRWVSIQATTGGWSVSLWEVYDHGHEGFLDVQAFPEHEDAHAEHDLPSPEEALAFGRDTYGATADRFVAPGSLGDEYREYLRSLGGRPAPMGAPGVHLGFSVGQVVFRQAGGLGVVTGFASKYGFRWPLEPGEEIALCSVRDDGGEEVLNLAERPHALRPVVDRDTAEALLSVLKGPAPPPPVVPPHEVLRRNQPVELVALLRGAYAVPPTDDRAARALEYYEELVLAELAHVLGRDKKKLASELRALHGVSGSL